MKCSINEQERAKQLVKQNWEAVTEKIEVDLEMTARETKAIQMFALSPLRWISTGS